MVVTDEDWLITESIKSNRKAQQMLFDKYRVTMLGVCIRYAKNRDEAEDILIESFVKVFKHLPDFQRKGSFEGWIRRTVINTAINYYRSNLKHANQVDYSEVQYAIEDTDKDIYQKEYDAEYLLKLIQELPEGCRVIFNMFEIENYAHKEIAEILGITESTSKTQLFHAKKILRKKLLERTSLN